jgi:hypothetical protein
MTTVPRHLLIGAARLQGLDNEKAGLARAQDIGVARGRSLPR